MNLKFKKRISFLLALLFTYLIITSPMCLVYAGDITTGLQNPLEADSFAELIEDIIDWVANIGILIAVGMIIYSGVLFMIAGGKDEDITKAKKTLTWSLVGLAILIMGKNWVTLVRSILGG